jgi:hypothetical protein
LEGNPSRRKKLKKLILAALLVALVFPVAAQSADGVVWTGPMIEFAKADGANPRQEANQDRITDSLWITRGNSGGQIYNAVDESRANARTSPENTLWALGTTDDLDGLNFRPFRATVDKPKDVVGKNLVLYIVSDEIYIDIVFTSWSTGKDGGFAYRRSTPAE